MSRTRQPSGTRVPVGLKDNMGGASERVVINWAVFPVRG